MRLLKFFLSFDVQGTPEAFLKNATPKQLAYFVQMVVIITFVASAAICWGAMTLLLLKYGKIT